MAKGGSRALLPHEVYSLVGQRWLRYSRAIAFDVVESA